nr:MAG TPA: hypothetical protein [Bacteriophage sp.]
MVYCKCLCSIKYLKIPSPARKLVFDDIAVGIIVALAVSYPYTY